MSSSSFSSIISKCTVYPEKKSAMRTLKLSVSDLAMLSCHYIQKGVLLSKPTVDSQTLISLLKFSLSKTLTHYPPLAGRLSTNTDGHIYIICNDAGTEFIHSQAQHLSINSIISHLVDVHDCFKQFFALDYTLNYAGHYKPIAAVQVTEIADGLFIGCSVNHAVVDGTSFWNFFNTFAQVCKGAKTISAPPDFCRENIFNSHVALPLPAGGPTATFSSDVPVPLREKIFHFSRDAILKLKFRANNPLDISETSKRISSFQSLSAQLWRSVTRARKLDKTEITTFKMALNCRHRLDPRVNPHYFGNLFLNIPIVASVGELLSKDLGWGADLLHRNVMAHDDTTVRRRVKDWEKDPVLLALGNYDGAMIEMGGSHMFPMYDTDFGWGRPLGIRSGNNNKFDGEISAFPGREGDGSIDMEVVLTSQTMARLETDTELMQYTS